MGGDPFLCFDRNGEQSLQVVKTERHGISLDAGLILERVGKSRGEERAFLAHVLSDRGFDVPAAERVGWFLVGSHPASSFVEMKVALLFLCERTNPHFREET